MLTALSCNLHNPAISKVVLFSELHAGQAHDDSVGATLHKDGLYVTTPVDDANMRRKVRSELLAHGNSGPCDPAAAAGGGGGLGPGAASGRCGITASNIDAAMRKIMLLPVTERLHFSTAIDFANAYLVGDHAEEKGEEGGSTCAAIANSDIYFDETLDTLQRFWPLDHRNASSPTVLALSKWSVLGPERDGEGGGAGGGQQLALSLRADSQDAWIFRVPLVPTGAPASSSRNGRNHSSSDSAHDENDSANPIIMNLHFPLGAPRCDNRLAKVLHNHGYVPLNTAMLVRAIEVSAPARKGVIYGQVGSVHGPGALVYLSDLTANESKQ
jgi:hypothetical protein